MKIGIIGLPNSGKTTIFNALTHNEIATSAVSSGKFETHLSTVDIPDDRVERLSQMFRPQKTTFAQIQFNDIGGLRKDVGKNETLNGTLVTQLSQTDTLMHVVRAFEDESVPHVEGSVEPNTDIHILDTELILADLAIVERRLERLQSSSNQAKNRRDESTMAEEKLLRRLQQNLDKEIPIRDMELDVDEEKLIRGFQFMTAKPVLLLLNGGDNGNDRSARACPYQHANSKTITIFGKLESELAQIPMHEAQIFFEEYGIQELGLNRAIRLSHELLGLIAFFTVGEDEVRAWTLKKGATIVEAAGVIHTDLARGFIRAEVVSYDDLITCGSLSAARQRGLLRLEGRDYIVRDGDVVNIRFNV